MCFSAPFSFVASGGLTAMGAYSLATSAKAHRILIAIPLLFGLQQAFEGVQWLYLNEGTSSPGAGYGFLIFALIVWPIYIPGFVFVLDPSRRKIMKGFLALGALVALYFSGLLVTQPLRIYELSGSIRYAFNFPLEWLVLPAYIVAVIGPLLISGIRIFRWFGLGISALAVVCMKLYFIDFLSVWCFFAAIVSAGFLVYARQARVAEELAL